MPIDPSIPLGIKPAQFMSPAQMISLRNVMRAGQLQQLQLMQAQRQMQTQAAVKQRLAQPNAIDQQTGMVSLPAIGDITALDYQTGTSMAANRARLEGVLSQEQQRKVKIADDLNKFREGIAEAAVNAADAAGPDPAQEQRAALEQRQKMIQEGVDNGYLRQLGVGPEGVTKMLQEPFDLQYVRNRIKKPTTQRWSPPYQMGGATVQRNLDTGEVRTAVSRPPVINVGTFGGKNGELLAALAAKGVTLPAGFRSQAQQAGLLESLWKTNPGLTADQIAEKIQNGQINFANIKKEGQVAAGIAGKISFAENELTRMVPIVEEAAKKLPRGQFIPFNKLQQMGESAFSNPDLAYYRLVMNSLANAYDMLASRGGTDMEKRAQARKNFDTAQSFEALQAVLKGVTTEAGVAKSAAHESILPPSEQGKSAETPAATDKFQVNKVYKDAKGNRAKYLGNGKWEEIK